MRTLFSDRLCNSRKILKDSPDAIADLCRLQYSPPVQNAVLRRER